MKRRTFIKRASIGTFAVGTAPFSFYSSLESHILTLSFDDGFKKSFYKTADIYEEYGLRACFNVIASGHLPSFKKPDDYILPELLGNFEDWNSLKKRGHEIMPHSWEHLNLARMPFKDAAARIDKCLNYFEEHLDGFKSTEAVFNFPFNASTPELEKYALSKVRAVRTGGGGAINKIPTSSDPVRLSCDTMGHENIDAWIDKKVNSFLATEGGWLILNTHGIDDEGWGPISSRYLRELLKRLVQIENLSILPAGEVLKLIA